MVDLKLKKLFEERRALQMRASEIMADLNISYFKILPNLKKQSNSKISSIERQREKLDDEYMSVKRDVGLLMPHHVESKAYLKKNKSFSLSLNFNTENKKEVANSDVVLNKSAMKNNSSEPFSHDSSIKEKSMHSSSDKVSVPWIFKAAFRIVEYVVSHKRESAFYAFIIFFTVYMVSSMMSRKN